MAININEYDQILYVNSSKGSDDNDGSKSKPFKTLSVAITKISGTNVLVYIDKGIYPITNLPSMSKSSKKIVYVGKSKDTILLASSCGSSYYGDIDIYNMIIKPSDSFTGDTRVLVYSGDNKNINFYNCLFLKSDNNKFPTNGLFYTSSSGSVYLNKNLYNCSIKGLNWICGAGAVKIYNCCTDASTINNLYSISTDCITGVVYDNNYRIDGDNSLYGIYSGDNKWQETRFLIKDGESYKTYDVQSNQLIDFTDNISELFNDNSESTFITDLNSVLTLINLKDTNVRIISNSNVKTISKAIKSTKQLFIASGDFSTRLADNIDYFKFNYSISDDNCTIKIAISIDSGKSWYSYQDDNWTKLTNKVTLKDYNTLSDDEKTDWNNLLDEILEKGIKVQDVTESLDFNTLNLEKARFAYAIEIQDVNSEVILKDLKWQFDSIGSYIQLNPKTEVNIGMNNNAISIQPLKDIELMKINVGISSNLRKEIDTSALLDKETFMGKESNSVKKADIAKGIYGEDTAPNNSVYKKDESGNLAWGEFPKYVPSTNLISQNDVIVQNMKSGKVTATCNLALNSSVPITNIFTGTGTRFATILDSNDKELILTMDLGSVIKFNAIGILTGYGCMKKFDIYTSEDGSGYTLADSYEYTTKDKKWVADTEFRVLLNKVIESRYIRINANGVFGTDNRYEMEKFSFYYDANFDTSLYIDYNNLSGIPYYSRRESYNKNEIDNLLKTSFTVTKQSTVTVDIGTYNSKLSSYYTSGVGTSDKQASIIYNFSDSNVFNIIGLMGTGYGGINDLDIYYSDDGTTYTLLQSVTNANIYTKDKFAYIGLKKLFKYKYLKMIFKKNVNGNRYEFKKDTFIYDKKLDNTPDIDVVNIDELI